MRTPLSILPLQNPNLKRLERKFSYAHEIPFFGDVETVQRMMVRLYGITSLGISTFMLTLLFFFNFAAISFAAAFVLGAGLSAIMNEESRPLTASYR